MTPAEPLLFNGYEGMKAREKPIPPQGSPHIPEALDRLIQLYTETNKPRRSEEVARGEVEVSGTKLKVCGEEVTAKHRSTMGMTISQVVQA